MADDFRIVILRKKDDLIAGSSADGFKGDFAAFLAEICGHESAAVLALGGGSVQPLACLRRAGCAEAVADVEHIEGVIALELAAGIVNVDLEGKTIEQILVEIAAPTVHIVTVIIMFVILFFVSKLLLKLLFKILDSIFNGSLLVIPNKIIGCAFNTLLGAVIAWILVFAFNFIIHLDSMTGVSWAAEFNGGPIYNFFLNLSPLDLLLGF